MLFLGEMQLSEIYVSLGDAGFLDLLRRVSMGRLRTYQMFDPLKVRLHLTKLNSEHLRMSAPRLFERIKAGDEELATDLAQAILVSHLDMIIETLDFLGIPHRDGFFDKGADISKYLSEDWQQRAYDALKAKHPESVLKFYLNHLAQETGKANEIFAGV